MEDRKDNIGRNILKRIWFALRTSFRDTNLYPLGRSRAVDVDACVDQYLKNMKIAKEYCGEKGAKCFVFLHPYNGAGKRSLSRFDTASVMFKQRNYDSQNRSNNDVIDLFYSAVMRKKLDDLHIVDQRNIFDGYKGEIYFDNAHVSDKGSDIIARSIVDEILMERD